MKADAKIYADESKNVDVRTITEALAITEKRIEQSLCSNSRGLSRMTNHLSMSKGKGIRAQVLLNSAMGHDGTVHNDATKAAAAVELLHMATLVHDDVIDNASLRRGMTTLNTEFGNKEAVICGDYLLCLALGMISDFVYEDYAKYAPLLPRMAKTLSKICEGEGRQILEIRNLNLSLLDYFRIISGKTAGLFFLSAYTGAIIGNCDDREIEHLSRFGRYLGMLFQIADDVKDYSQSRAEAKKPVKHDLLQGIVTLPMIFALRKNSLLNPIAARIFNNNETPASLIKEVIGTGAIDDTKKIAERYRQKARKCISRLTNETKKNALMHILEQV